MPGMGVGGTASRAPCSVAAAEARSTSGTDTEGNQYGRGASGGICITPATWCSPAQQSQYAMSGIGLFSMRQPNSAR